MKLYFQDEKDQQMKIIIISKSMIFAHESQFILITREYIIILNYSFNIIFSFILNNLRKIIHLFVKDNLYMF
jgi:hypothetical protein